MDFFISAPRILYTRAEVGAVIVLFETILLPEESGERGQALLPVYDFKLSKKQAPSIYENRLDKQALFVVVPFVGIALVWRYKKFSLFKTLEDRSNSFVLGSGLAPSDWLLTDFCQESIVLLMAGSIQWPHAGGWAWEPTYRK